MNYVLKYMRTYSSDPYLFEILPQLTRTTSFNSRYLGRYLDSVYPGSLQPRSDY